MTNARRVAETRLDPGEEVEVVLAPAREIPEMIRRGEIDHALVVAGLLWWLADERSGQRRRRRESPERYECYLGRFR